MHPANARVSLTVRLTNEHLLKWFRPGKADLDRLWVCIQNLLNWAGLVGSGSGPRHFFKRNLADRSPEI